MFADVGLESTSTGGVDALEEEFDEGMDVGGVEMAVVDAAGDDEVEGANTAGPS